MSSTGKGGRSGNFFAQFDNRTWLTIVVVILSIWFVLANTASAEIRFWIPTVEAPMWIVLIGTFAVGAFTGWLIKARRG
ncbi:MAG TPA: LapA family protein [Yinghuangia sp.]|uniref:lipopolysaccharide assembly protein LapA domain-containing protein n=1 Tax=Yinghuangia sp. YIM S10712 TaxID=3436930 RepID=UPI002D1D0207|nr:LapA family protein [Yinghuangia sp.]